ncbi:hypothetical protein [Klebsiella quasipneumoniae]|uniref:hypothetical protein n=1 Tax=Klebsiella quasipneumoniae TaxID=1463165 RepID=UPI0014853303|nr:hypothetical protein [Klebsiella quasipneumoniae]
MVKRHTIELLATEKAVPLKLNARQQALVDAVANRAPPAEPDPVPPVGKADVRNRRAR